MRATVRFDSVRKDRRSRRSFGGYPDTASSGKRTRSDPSFSARRPNATIFSELPAKSPTVVSICAIATRSERSFNRLGPASGPTAGRPESPAYRPSATPLATASTAGSRRPRGRPGPRAPFPLYGRRGRGEPRRRKTKRTERKRTPNPVPRNAGCGRAPRTPRAGRRERAGSRLRRPRRFREHGRAGRRARRRPPRRDPKGGQSGRETVPGGAESRRGAGRQSLRAEGTRSRPRGDVPHVDPSEQVEIAAAVMLGELKVSGRFGVLRVEPEHLVERLFSLVVETVLELGDALVEVRTEEVRPGVLVVPGSLVDPPEDRNRGLVISVVVQLDRGSQLRDFFGSVRHLLGERRIGRERRRDRAERLHGVDVALLGERPLRFGAKRRGVGRGLRSRGDRSGRACCGSGLGGPLGSLERVEKLLRFRVVRIAARDSAQLFGRLRDLAFPEEGGRVLERSRRPG